ncbi:MAG: hypothetical protein ACRDZ3_20750 [Acidimicrobiia bacterium]
MPRGAHRTWDVDIHALDIEELGLALQAAGKTPRTVRLIVGYVAMVQAGQDSETHKSMDSRYRRHICEALAIPPGPPPRNAMRRAVAELPARVQVERGAASVGALVAAALLAAPIIHVM